MSELFHTGVGVGGIARAERGDSYNTASPFLPCPTAVAVNGVLAFGLLIGTPFNMVLSAGRGAKPGVGVSSPLHASVNLFANCHQSLFLLILSGNLPTGGAEPWECTFKNGLPTSL